MGDIMTRNLRTNRPKIFKLGVQVQHMTHCVWPLSKVKRSKV